MTKPELMAKLLREGGRILIAGGQLKRDLPQSFHEHPQIIIWDDDRQELQAREVPSNVKVIIYTRLNSHQTTKKLSNAANLLHAIKFPMLRIREIKELMSEVIQTEPVESTTTEQSEIVETDMAQPKTLKEFIAKYINIHLDYTIKGTIAEEGRRLFEIAKKDKFQTTILSVQQALRLFVRDMLTERPGSVKAVKTKSSPKVTVKNNDFDYVDKLLGDAIAAMKLIQEHLPKMRKEVEKSRNMKAKVLSLLE